MRVLGIETSCDETAVCVIEADGGFDNLKYSVLGNALISQSAIHAPYGGVFPNLAKREHERNLVPLLQKALEEANLLHQALLHQGEALMQEVGAILVREAELRAQLDAFLAVYAKPDIDAIAVTHGPGLEPALWVGVNFAKALAAAWDVPIVPVNHMEGHVVIAGIRNVEGNKSQVAGNRTKTYTLSPITFPLLSLLISGGHTELVLSREWMQYEVIGQTRDDAVGEAFDKVARLLGLPYPGGPEISKLAAAARGERQNDGRLTSIILPRPMMDSGDFDFSFAGLKTAVRRVVEAEELTDERRRAIALEFENAAADVLVAKTMRAIKEFGAEAVVVGGGVSANTHIRQSLAQAIKDYGLGTKLLIPPPSLATDNALMIALAGYFRAQKGEFAQPDSIRAQGNLKLA
jgi:N6-L-threonylcarbamoyladenine synthase